MYKIVTKFFSLTLVSLFVITSPYTLPLYGEENAPSPVELPKEKELTQSNPFGEDGPQEVRFWKEFSRMMMILGTILAIVLLIAWLLRNFLNKRIRQVNQSNIIKVLERRNLSQKSMIYLIEVYNKQFLIGDSAAGGVEFLMECEPDEEAITQKITAPIKTSKFSFIEILQRKLTEKQPKPTNLKQ